MGYLRAENEQREQHNSKIQAICSQTLISILFKTMTYRFLLLIALVMAGINSNFAFVSRPAFCVKNGSATSLQMTVLSYNGKKKDFKAGTPLSKAVAQLGVKPNYSCKK
jgi:hypothetical protein